jgi:hypothetical protein
MELKHRSFGGKCHGQKPIPRKSLALFVSILFKECTDTTISVASSPEPVSYHVFVLTIASCGTSELLPCGQQGALIDHLKLGGSTGSADHLREVATERTKFAEKAAT